MTKWLLIILAILYLRYAYATEAVVSYPSGTPVDVATQADINSSSVNTTGWTKSGSDVNVTVKTDMVTIPDFRRITNGTITRDTDNYITIIDLDNRNITITRDTNHYISSISDGVYTWNYTRNNTTGFLVNWNVNPIAPVYTTVLLCLDGEQLSLDGVNLRL
jgi:hypothetical protein